MAHLVEIRTEQTYPLRRSVLRDGTPSDVVAFDGDDLESTFHLGIEADDEVVAISTWIQRDFPDIDFPMHTGNTFQVRGMAIAPQRRGTGLGRILLEAGIELCHHRHATMVWARARDSSLGFYEHHKFSVVGKGYTDDVTGLPHHDVILGID